MEKLSPEKSRPIIPAAKFPKQDGNLTNQKEEFKVAILYIKLKLIRNNDLLHRRAVAE
ncbi:MAG: hypothetical protein M0Z67_18540 [Nitrospiraceae bacterium]|nr:hypothetical protein [Nitrospiraceae bacterium]